MKEAFLIANIEEYGKFISYCIENDVTVFRTYWDEREKGDRCFSIDWEQKRCFYSRRSYYEHIGYEIIEPKFELSNYGDVYKITNLREVIE